MTESLPAGGESVGVPATPAPAPSREDRLLPPDVYDDAEWFAANQQRFWKARRTLLEWVARVGPIRLGDGRLVQYLPDGNAWDETRVAEEFPALIKRAEASFSGTQQEIERVLSLVLEEVPNVEWNVRRSVDATAANNAIRAGGPAAERLRELRTTKSKLGVR